MADAFRVFFNQKEKLSGIYSSWLKMGLWTAHKRKKEKKPVAIKGLPSRKDKRLFRIIFPIFSYEEYRQKSMDRSKV